MRFLTIGTIVTALILSIESIYAQDSTVIDLEHRESISPLVTFKEEFYSSPSLKYYERNHNFSQIDASYFSNDQDLFVKQEGSGNHGLRFDAKSYLKNSPTSTLWGEAYYRNETIHKVSYNESNDYKLIYPYVMADTIGGDLLSETYFFSGGFAKKLASFEYGFYASFRGVQAYRDRDPRPKNITSDIKTTLSISKPIQKYVASADLNFRKYDQENTLQFASELGVPLIFHDAGLGAYNNILAGSRSSAYYRGYTVGGQFNLIPANQNGFIAQIAYNQFSLKKDLPDIAAPVGEAIDQEFHALIGYTKATDKQIVALKLKASHCDRKGTEAKFDNRNSGNSLQKISEDIRYKSDRNAIRAEAIYGRKSFNFDWFLQGNAYYIDHRQEYIGPDRLLNYGNFGLGINIEGVKTVNKILLTAQVGIQNTKNLEGEQYWNDLSTESGIFQMLNSNYQYLTSSNFQIQGKLRVDYQFPRNLNFFIQSSGNYTSYSNPYTGKQLIITTGFIF